MSNLTPRVPNDNSTDNITMADVVGSRADNSFSGWVSNPSIVGHLKAEYYHVHDSARVYPRTDDDNPLAAITVTASATALTFGDWVEITNFDSKALLADVHHLYINTISAVDIYTIQLGTGASGSQVFWGESAFSRDTNQNRVAPVPIQGPPIPAGTKLWARLASEGGGGDSCKIKAYTHEYLGVTGN